MVCASRELGGGLRLVSDEVSYWRCRATAITEPAARSRVLRDLRDKRSYLNGAAYFATLSPRRSPGLVRLLVAFQVLANYIDTLSERDASKRNGPPRCWTTMLVDAVDLDQTPEAGLYANLPEGGYLAELVTACRRECAALAGYAQVRANIGLEARRGATLDIGHDPCPSRRAAALRCFIAREFQPHPDLTWWELAAGTSSMLTVTLTLALAAGESGPHPEDAKAAIDAYRLVASLSALLDNYIDQVKDRSGGGNNYILAYGDGSTGAARVGALVERALREVARLPHGHRHILLVAMMIALFLSSEEAHSVELQEGTRALLTRAGTTTRILLPALRAWRIAHNQRAG